jgi:hypothetical protein
MHNPPVDGVVKEERLRMLEHEFGKKGDPATSGGHVIGSVDEKGALITTGPKQRVTARWVQGILALATAVSSLYGALVRFGFINFLPLCLTVHTVYKITNTSSSSFKTTCFRPLHIQCCHLLLYFLSLCTPAVLLRQAEQICQP